METIKILIGLVAAVAMVGVAVGMLIVALTGNPGGWVLWLFSGALVAGSVPFLD